MTRSWNSKLSVVVAATLSLSWTVACSPAPAPAPAPRPVAPAAATPTPQSASAAPGAPTPAAPVARPTAPPSPVAPRSEQPRRGGVLVGVSNGDPADLDPLGATTTQFFHIWGNVYSHIVQYNGMAPVDQIVPDLAESWEIGPDFKTYTFRIRDGVKWHDGRPFTAQDAKFGVDLLKDKGAFIKSELEAIQKVEAPDPKTLRIVLSRPRASLLYVLGLMPTPIVGKHVYETAGGNLKNGPNIGTGPFKQGKYTRGVVADLERNPDYFERGLPYLDGVKVVIIRDDNTRLAAFRTRQVHFLGLGATSVNRVEVEQLRSSVPGLQPNEHLAMSAKMLQINAKVRPWDDVRVRRAAFLAIDRWIALEVLDDTTRPAGPVVPPNWALPDQELLALPGYRKGADKQKDRDEAKRLLAEAGLPTGFDTESITPSTVARLVKLQVFIKDQLQTVGIRVSSVTPLFAEWNARRDKLQFEVMALQASVAYPDPDSAAKNLLPGLFSNLEDAKTFDLFGRQSLERDPAKRREQVYEMQRRMIEVVNQVPIAWVSDFLPTQSEVRGFVAPLGPWIAYRWEYVWLAP